MTDKHVHCPEKSCNYWYPLDPDVFAANLHLCELLNQLIEEKWDKINRDNESSHSKVVDYNLESGWYPPETWIDRNFNWTNGTGKISIMKNISGISFQYLCIYPFIDMKLKVFVDGILVLSENMAVTDCWTEKSIELKDHQAPFIIEIESDYFVPKISGISDDSRTLGIAVSGIKIW
jgi:hypothetical protein